MSQILARDSHVMIDVETLGKKPGSAILSIGAVKFDPTGRRPIHLLPENQLYVVINSFDSNNYGFASDPDTLRWWKKQAIWPQLSMSIVQSNTTVAQATKSLTKFLHTKSATKVWANSPSFDLEMLKELYKAVKQEFPTTYRDEMDYRTVMELVYPDRTQRPGRPPELASLPPHHALGDSALQAHLLIGAIARLQPGHGFAANELAFGYGPPGRHLMLEVKTLGRTRGSGVLSIGATVFDPTGRTAPHMDKDNHFYVVINNFDSGNYGFSSDPDTMRWWKTQPIWPELSTETMRSPVTVVQATRLLSRFIEDKKPDKVWANSPAFDIEMLREIYKTVRQPFPVTYRQEMDFRTVMELVYPDRNNRPVSEDLFGFKAHHALGDALGQSDTLIRTLKRLQLDLDSLAHPVQSPSTDSVETASKRRRITP